MHVFDDASRPLPGGHSVATNVGDGVVVDGVELIVVGDNVLVEVEPPPSVREPVCVCVVVGESVRVGDADGVAERVELRDVDDPLEGEEVGVRGEDGVLDTVCVSDPGGGKLGVALNEGEFVGGGVFDLVGEFNAETVPLVVGLPVPVTEEPADCVFEPDGEFEGVDDGEEERVPDGVPVGVRDDDVVPDRVAVTDDPVDEERDGVAGDDGVTVFVAVADGVTVFVAVADGVGEREREFEGVSVFDSVPDFVGLTVAVRDRVPLTDGVFVTDGVPVIVALIVPVRELLCDAPVDILAVGDGVGEQLGATASPGDVHALGHGQATHVALDVAPVELLKVPAGQAFCVDTQDPAGQ